MNQIHDLFMRAYAMPTDEKKKKKQKARKSPASNQGKWPIHALVFDTETRITADQSLTFGVFRLCKLENGRYRTVREGIFYVDDLPEKDRQVLAAYVQTAVSDVPGFPPEFRLYSRSEFMQKVFWPSMKRDGALICGLNLPFDLARLALAWNRGDHDEWSLTMSQFPNGVENRYYPRILITPIDSKKAFINSQIPGNQKSGQTRGKRNS